ncbi:MAG: group II intron reverse transcriptase/maturase [Gammaproteobacteria bacterium]|nr:group II intron reverse transcriptase/maturase [Gammaproteobacteria bacterium]
MAVWEAYQRVRANQGAAGVDHESLAQFERNLKRNLYKIWNRMASGSYLPPPVRQVEIPKANGGVRKLGVPTVADRIAQTVVKQALEPRLDPLFDKDSYGYRPGRSAKEAVAATKNRCWRYDWVVEFDIKGAFDNIDHALLMKAVTHHVKDRWMLLYIERWLKAPFMAADGTCIPRDQGTPQGGVVSPLLMNLFMHYTFDTWMRRHFPHNPFARYADDAVIHCRTESEAREVLQAIDLRLRACRLTLHPEKSKIVYCQDSNRRRPYPVVQFTFLGFTFRPRKAISPKGACFTTFSPAASDAALKRMRRTVRDWKIPQQTAATLSDLSIRYNAVLRGWWNYYGAFRSSELQRVFRPLDLNLMRWARRKYKRLAGHRCRSAEWLNRMRKTYPQWFVHWRLGCAHGG